MKGMVYILTIERNAHRYDKLCKYLNDKQIKHTLFFGVDSKVVSPQIIKQYRSNYFCPYSVTCCALSHILLWNYIANSEYDYGIILEDDTYPIIEKFNVHMKEIYNHVINDRFVYLYYDFNLKINRNIVLSLGSYAINKNIARKLYEHFYSKKIKFHIDVELNFVLKDLDIDTIVYKICRQIEGNKSSMRVRHDTFYIDILKNTMFHRALTTPILVFNEIELDTYCILIFVLSILLMLYYGPVVALTFGVYLIYIILDLTHFK